MFSNRRYHRLDLHRKQNCFWTAERFVNNAAGFFSCSKLLRYHVSKECSIHEMEAVTHLATYSTKYLHVGETWDNVGPTCSHFWKSARILNVIYEVVSSLSFHALHVTQVPGVLLLIVLFIIISVRVSLFPILFVSFKSWHMFTWFCSRLLKRHRVYLVWVALYPCPVLWGLSG